MKARRGGKKRRRTGQAKQAAEKEALPIVKQRDEIIKAVKENQVSIVVGETGSGKTTRKVALRRDININRSLFASEIPQFLFQAGVHQGKLIGVTQPRRVAAVTVARRVANELGVDIGQQVLKLTSYCRVEHAKFFAFRLAIVFVSMIAPQNRRR